MEPARSIIEKLGGTVKVAAITGVHRSRVYSWMRPKDDGGTGGTIPFWHAQALIREARALHIELHADDFLPPEPPARRRVAGGVQTD